MTSSWRIEDAESSATPTGVAASSMVSLHYLRSALRRRWRLVAACGLAGLLVAVAVLSLAPHKVTASATVLLAHDPSLDPNTAMATDVSLLETRSVAEKVISQLGLKETPDELLKSVRASEPSTQVLQIDLTAPTGAAAVERLTAFSDAFLTFRNDALRTQANSIVTQDRGRIDSLRKQVNTLSAQYDTAVQLGLRQKASQLLSQRAQLLSQIEALQQTIQDTAVQADSLATASHLVDRPAVVPKSRARTVVLAVASGLIGGVGIGVVIVFAVALVSNRLRRREEIATALDTSVRFSTGPVRALRPWRQAHAARNLDVLAAGLGSVLPDDGSEPGRVALVAASDLPAAARVVRHAAARLREQGKQVVMVDLTEAGTLVDLAGADQVQRPEGRPELAKGPLALVSSQGSTVAELDSGREQWKDADVVLVLGEVELGVGTSHLASWAERSVVFVGAGQVTAELLRSTSRMLAAVGPEVEFAMLVGADHNDESLGLPPGPVHHEQQRQAR